MPSWNCFHFNKKSGFFNGESKHELCPVKRLNFVKREMSLAQLIVAVPPYRSSYMKSVLLKIHLPNNLIKTLSYLGALFKRAFQFRSDFLLSMLKVAQFARYSVNDLQLRLSKRSLQFFKTTVTVVE